MISKHPYLTATLVATLLAVVVWLCVPKEYTAVIKLSDEYKEMDLAIGLDDMMAKIKKAMSGDGNEGMNDMAVYSKVLVTEDFARRISHKQVPGKGVSYGEYLASEDTIDAVIDNINYNYSGRKETLTISLTDRDPLVAAQMLDSVTAELQHILTDYRHRLADAALKDVVKGLQVAKKEFEEAENTYNTFAESHTNSSTKVMAQQEKGLEREMSAAYKHYETLSKQYARQQALKQRSYCSFALIHSNTVPAQTNNHLIGYILFFVTIGLFLTKCYLTFTSDSKEKYRIDTGGLFSPWSVTIIVWVALAFSFMLYGDSIDPVPQSFYVSISIWLAVFLSSSFLTFNLFTPKNSIVVSDGIDVNIKLFYFFFILTLVLTPLYIYQIYKLIAMFDTKDLMTNVRELAIHGDGYGWLNYTLVINQALLLVGLWLYPKIPLWQLICIILTNFACGLANMEKMTFFLVFISSMYMLFEKRIIRKRTIILLSGGLLLLFYLFNLSRAAEDSDYQKNETLLDFLGMYLMSPPVAFGHLRQLISDEFCSDTLWGVYLYYYKYVEGIIRPYNPFAEFVNVSVLTNVYTILRPFWQDLGNTGVAFFAFVYGIFTGYFYRLARNGKAFGICMYTYIVFVLALQFYDELIFASLPLFIQRVIILYFICQTNIKFVGVKPGNNAAVP